MKITEKCGCGAEFEAEGADDRTASIDQAARAWREDHKHAEREGICGEPCPQRGPYRYAPLCDLKANHTGLHHAEWPDGGDVHWPALPGGPGGRR